jgi:hypothetical protein
MLKIAAISTHVQAEWEQSLQAIVPFSISEYTLFSPAADDDDVYLRGKSFALIERVCYRRKLETSFSLLFFPPFFFSSCWFLADEFRFFVSCLFRLLFSLLFFVFCLRLLVAGGVSSVVLLCGREFEHTDF